jgi:hypothetical protein
MMINSVETDFVVKGGFVSWSIRILWGDVVFTAELVEYIEPLKTEERTVNDWQITSSALLRTCAVKGVKR